MSIIKENHQDGQQKIFDVNAKVLGDYTRCLTMLKKTLERMARQCWYNETQYPEIYFEILAAISSVQMWIKEHKLFSKCQFFQDSLAIFIMNIADQISILIETSRPSSGKKKVKKTLRQRQQGKIHRAIKEMIDHLSDYSGKSEHIDDTQIGESIKKALVESFENNCLKPHDFRHREFVSQRGEKTWIFPWKTPENYHELVEDANRFKHEIVERLKNYKHGTGHKANCKCQGNYKLKGFRRCPRKTVMPGGHKEEFRIRMVECSDCGQKFSLLPSFIPREKHFSIDIIGSVLRSIVLFGQSLNGAFESFEMCGRRLKSRQTLLNWLLWAGTFHPATLLERCGAQCQGYFQEDEGFEKEPGLRTYTVVMADPKTQLIWHIDYVDHVDEKNLCTSFEDFLQRINFNVKGVTKDKWKPSTNALKSVFNKVWIGFCHLHYLKKLNKALASYQMEAKCSWKKVNELYRKIKKIMDTATHAGSLKAQLKALDDKAFQHPLVKKRIDDLRENATHYTSHKQRSGITITTSIVDNFLKIVKRKLNQVESFRDKTYTQHFFNAMANIRNFVPFMPGAKNVGKSPFMLAGGETYDLPWAQVINMHNGFLFTPKAL